jgi:hypothetical protein
MNVDIKCIKCNELLTFGTMAKQSMKQSAKQAFNWKVMLGLKKVEWMGTLLIKTSRENLLCLLLSIPITRQP